MPHYRRVHHPGGTYFTTHTLLQRRGSRLLVDHIDTLRRVAQKVRMSHPFTIHAWVVLPEHLHCIIELPDGETSSATRWRLIKACFSRSLPDVEARSVVRRSRLERGIWQRRFWEHLITDDRDYAAHMDYIHFNPVKHGCVKRVADWPYSTFARCVQRDLYPLDWAGGSDPDLVTDPYDV